MTEQAALQVEVVYARPDKQELITLHLPPGTTARQAVQEAGLQASFPELDTANCPLGIFGTTVADDHLLRTGDRVEIYRPLTNDPREQRRVLAARGQVMGRQNQDDSEGA